MNVSLFGSLSLLFGMVSMGVGAAEPPLSPIVTRSVEGGQFHEVAEAVKSAIVGKGINIAHVVESGDTLHRTGKDFGYTHDLYRHAVTFEFCNMQLSHELVRVNPQHIVLCPFTMSVYELEQQPGTIQITYKVPEGFSGSEPISERIRVMLESIVNDAMW